MAWDEIQSPQDLVLVDVSCFLFHRSPLCSLGATTLAPFVSMSSSSARLAFTLAVLCLECSAPRSSVTASFLFEHQFKCHLLTLTSKVQFSTQALCNTEPFSFPSEHIPQASIILIIYLFVYCLPPIENVNFLRTGTSSLLFTMGSSGIVSVKYTHNKYLLNKLIKNEAL